MIWAVYALLATFFFAAQSEANKHFKLDGFTLNTFRTLITAVLLAPFLPLMEWPDNPVYYLIILMIAAMNIIMMMVFYNLAARQNGRVACLYQPLSVFLIFVAWLFIDSVQRQFLADNPVNLAFILGGFVVFGFGVFFIRRNDAGLQILMTVFPIAVLFTIGTILTKLFLQEGESPIGITLNFVFLAEIAMFVMSFPIYLSRNIKSGAPLVTLPLLKGAAVISVLHGSSWILFNMALIFAPNPAYVSMMDSLIPVWFMIYYKFRGEKDDASPLAGLALAIAAAIILIAAH